MLGLEIMDLFRAMPGSVAQGLIWGIMAIGVYITFRILDFADLTVDGSLGLGGAVAVMLILAGFPPYLVLIISFISGLLAGLVTGLLHTSFGNSGYPGGDSDADRSVFRQPEHNGQGKSGSQCRSFRSGRLSEIYFAGYRCRSDIPDRYYRSFVLVFGTEQGFTIRATGCNQEMARAQGISTNKAKVVGLALGNGLVGLSGALVAQYSGNADVNKGRGAIVIGLAAVIIGEVIGNAVFRKRMNFALKLFLRRWERLFTIWSLRLCSDRSVLTESQAFLRDCRSRFPGGSVSEKQVQHVFYEGCEERSGIRCWRSRISIKLLTKVP